MMKFLLILSLLFSANYFAQQSTISKNVNKITEFVASENFLSYKNNAGELQSIDTIYKKAIEVAENNLSEALLALTFSLIPYKEVPILLPGLNLIIKYPLISHNDSVYQKKNQNLPKHFLFDSSPDDFGDKDKLAHFFGNAFIGYHSTFFDLGFLIGYFVEAFEEDFKVQSSIDERDLKVNELGNIFGKILKENKDILPSRVLVTASTKYFIYNFP